MISNTQAPFILKKLRSLDHAGIKRLVLKLLKKQVCFRSPFQSVKVQSPASCRPQISEGTTRASQFS